MPIGWAPSCPDMENLESPRSTRRSHDLDQSMGSSASRFSLLNSILPEELQNWLPKEVLSIPCKLSPANRELLLRKYGITELHWASLTRSMADAGDLLNKGADVHKTTLRMNRRPSARDSLEIQGVTPLFLAARLGHSALVEVLLEHGAVEDILRASSRGDTALHAAALSGDVGVMNLLLNALAASPRRRLSGGDGGAIVDIRGYKKRTPLHYAAGGGHPTIVGALLQAGADPSACDEHGATPFHFAAGWGNSIDSMVRLNMDPTWKQNVDGATDKKGWTALHYAVRNGHVETVQWLLDRGAFINAVESLHGNAPLHLAARHPGVIRLLTSKGADIWLENKNGEVAIGLAHSHRNAMAVKAHIKAIQTEIPREAVDPFTKHGKDGATLLHYVSSYGTAEDMVWIVGLSAFQEEITATSNSGGETRINTVDNAGRTAVHWAAIAGNVDALKILAKHRADLNAVDDDGRSVLCLAIANSKGGMDFVNAFFALPPVKLQIQKWVTHDEAARWMKEYYHVQNLQAVMVSKLKKLRKTRAIAHRIVTQSIRRMKACFHSAILHCNRHMASPLPSKETRQVTRNSDLYNPLDDLPPVYLALHAGREDIAIFMQEHVKGSAWQDAVVNRKGEETQRTALHWATILGERDIVTKLCISPMFSRELKPNVDDKYGKTPLQYAKELNQAAIERQLLERKDVKNHLEGLYRDRQVYVDAANAVLVAAALIASVTFAGWLQPPLNYVTYYDMPLPPIPSGATDGAYASYAAVQQHLGVRIFWGFNSLSFTFAIATVLAGLVGVVPIPRRYIATTVVHLRRTLWVASVMLALSIVFVLGAFAAAGFTVLPPVFKYQANMMGTIILGGIPCILLLAWFVGILCISRQRDRSDSLSAPVPPPPPPRPPVVTSSRPWESDDPMTWFYAP